MLIKKISKCFIELFSVFVYIKLFEIEYFPQEFECGQEEQNNFSE